MTTTSERLLALAASYEEKAKALRFAAAELNGHLTTQAQVKSDTTLKAAMTLRKQQQRTAPQEDTETRRMALIRDHLASGPHSTRDIRTYLATHGIRASTTTIRHILHTMKDVRLTGNTSSARWHARGARARMRDTPKEKPQTTP